MEKENYNVLLYEKMKLEQDRYRDWLLTQTPEEILNHTYEYTVREDILMCVQEMDLESEKAKALFNSPYPLAGVLKEFNKRDDGHMGVIQDSIEMEADKSFWREIAAKKGM